MTGLRNAELSAHSSRKTAPRAARTAAFRHAGPLPALHASRTRNDPTIRSGCRKPPRNRSRNRKIRSGMTGAAHSARIVAVPPPTDPAAYPMPTPDRTKAGRPSSNPPTAAPETPERERRTSIGSQVVPVRCPLPSVPPAPPMFRCFSGIPNRTPRIPAMPTMPL